MRVWLSGGATVLAVAAAVVSVPEHATTPLVFFVIAGALAGIQTWAARAPFAGRRRDLSIAIAGMWLIAAVAIGALLLYFQAAASRPEPTPEATYLGLTATTYHLVALYGGAILVTLSAFLPQRWTEPVDR